MKEEWTKTFGIVRSNCWSLNDLREMNDRDSIHYKDAIQAGIKGPVACNIKPNLHEFKAWIREQSKSPLLL